MSKAKKEELRSAASAPIEEVQKQALPGTVEQIQKAVAKKVQPAKKKTIAGPHAVLDNLLKTMRERNPELLIGRGTEEYIDDVLKIHHFPSGIPQLDFLLSGGLPGGRFIVLYGPESCGKTTVSMVFIAQYLLEHPEEYVLILDAENSVDADWAKQFGVDMSRVIVIPGTMPLEDMATEGVRALRLAKENGVIIRMCLVDSASSMTPAIEVEGKKEGRGQPVIDMRQDSVGTAARKIRRFLSTWCPTVRSLDCATIIISHVTVDIANQGRLIAKGGYALKHFPHAILRMWRKNDQSFEKEIICPDGVKRNIKAGFFTVINLEKTKISKYEGHSIAIPFLVGVGFQTSLALLNSAVGYGIVERSGSWFKYKGESIGQGAQAAAEWLSQNKLKSLEIEQSLLTLMHGGGGPGLDDNAAPEQAADTSNE